MKSLELHLICPHCLVENDLVSHLGVDDDPPEPYPGALSLCIKCGKFSVFDASMGLRKPRPEEVDHIADDPECQAIHRMWKATGRNMN